MANRIEISESDGEEADILVCLRFTMPLHLPDNLTGTCAQCGHAIQYRPHAPTTPKKICAVCAEPELKRLSKRGELVAMVTPDTADEVKSFFAKKRQH